MCSASSKLGQLANACAVVGYGLANRLRLSMNYLVYNEASTLEANIRYHASLGVDSFVVADNGSTDGTREIATRLAGEFPMSILDKPPGEYRQSDWKTEMAVLSRRKHGAHWSIANDADEFWLARGGNFKQHLSRWGATIYCQRYNMLPGYADFVGENPYYLASHLVVRPIQLSQQDVLYDPAAAIMLHKIHGKVLANNYGLVRVHGGNHRVSHLGNPLAKRKSNQMLVLHYSLQSKQRLLNILARRIALLSQGEKMGNHYRRWARLLDQGKFDKECQRLAPQAASMRLLKDFGVVDSATSYFDRLDGFAEQYHRLVAQLKTGHTQ